MKSFFYIMIITSIISYSPLAAFSKVTTAETDMGKEIIVGMGFPDYQEKLQGYFGIAPGFAPDYEGSDDISVTALPIADIRKPGIFFLKGASINPNDGLTSAGLTLLHSSYRDSAVYKTKFAMGPLLRVYGGRDEDDNEVLKGLGDIDPTIAIGGFTELYAGNWLLNLTLVSQNVGDDTDGLLLNIDVKYTIHITDDMTISPILSASWGDGDYMQGFFGVTSAQAEKSGHSLFNSKAGMKDVGLQLHTSYALTTHLSLDSQLGYWHLLNDAADSPIVANEGSDNQFRGLLGLSFHF